MATINKHMIDFCIVAYRMLQNEESDRACYIQYRESSERYVQYIMEKKSWYFGNYALFDGGAYVASIEESLLKHWLSEDESKKQQTQ